ncbi:CoA-transferase family III domain-containing protein [Dactylonectria macrodidyma]|uniref:CoA-transferase family III domain-containing protein n=1 Tax=Dactylonectria macrodidyma TaxID=307937 RepID=A0A9P9J270_9HYPO|nr:CoA-transferase family III domain-containing protein [Dactylonectria macrodidyma]
MPNIIKSPNLSTTSYSVPQNAEAVFRDGVLGNPLVMKELPTEAVECARNIQFEGSSNPSIPVNWRFAESVTALKAYEATIINVLLKRKYGIEAPHVKIDTDHAQLFIMSALLWTVDPDGEKMTAASIQESEFRARLAKLFPSWDKYGAVATPHASSATNIYKCKDEKFFHIHGSLNPEPTLKSLGLPITTPAKTLEEAWPTFVEAVGKISSNELQHKVSDVFRQAGTICYTADEYRNSEQGKSNTHVGLFEIHHHRNLVQGPSWWPDSPRTSAVRPLAGLKVLDLTRVIAAPAASRGLAELGAHVMRIAAPHLPDTSALHVDLNVGKWNALLDLRQPEDRQKLRDLIMEADVFLQGYRPGALDKYGFGEQDILALCKQRERGIVYARLNTYGWQGPWSQRSGWQQISDASCGVSFQFGQAMGNDEPVTPVFPNSDYCTGITGTIGIMTALLRRAQTGGSYTVDIALNYYSRWLVDSCGVYPDKVWEELWTRNGRQVFRHFHNMQYTLPKVLGLLVKSKPQVLFRPEFYTTTHAKVVDKDIRIVAPVLRYPNGEVEPGYDIGTRTNGVDQPRWPQDLTVEVVV